ncbi:MAG: peroxiredoxin family protein [Woeseiaceae bacterium]
MKSSRAVFTAMIAGAALVSLFGCENKPAPESEPAPIELEVGYWQAFITLPGGDVEAGIEISQDGELYQASLINGQERVRIDSVIFADGELTLRFPAFNSEVNATLVDGRLVGDLTLVKRYGETQTMPFNAVPGSESRQETSAAPGTDLSGRWAVTFHEEDADDDSYIGEFAQRGSRLFGTFLHPNGDYRYLAGHVRGNEFRMSTFDGSHVFFFSGSVGDDGRISRADFWSGTTWHQQWSGVRNENATLPDAFSRTFLKPGYDRFEFEFANEDGVLVSIDDEKYRDKVLIVTIAGTWCPNCNDEARFLAPFHKKYRDQGLEIVALLFEHFEDAELAAAQARRFREKFDIEYDTLIAGISDKTDAAETLPALSAVLAFPTTIFIDRAGQVRQIHTGFVGPGTGEHYINLQDSFTELTTALLDEPAGAAEPNSTDDPPGEDLGEAFPAEAEPAAQE